MFRLLLAPIALAGCGRIAFDVAAQPDGSPDSVVPLGHDEDGDGVPDTTDVCPHVAGTQADADGDGVGDDCDPNFGLGRDRIALFVTMQPGDMPFIPNPATDGTWTQGPDGLFLDGPLGGDFFAGGEIPLTAGDVQVSIGIDITAIGNPTTQHQFSLGTITPVPHYFGDINERLGTYSNVQISRFDGTLYNQIQAQGLPGGIHTGRALVTLTEKVNTLTRLDMTWPGEPYSVEVSDTLYQGSDRLQFNINNLQLQILYVCVITSS